MSPLCLHTFPKDAVVHTLLEDSSLLVARSRLFTWDLPTRNVESMAVRCPFLQFTKKCPRFVPEKTKTAQGIGKRLGHSDLLSRGFTLSSKLSRSTCFLFSCICSLSNRLDPLGPCRIFNSAKEHFATTNSTVPESASRRKANIQKVPPANPPPRRALRTACIFASTPAPRTPSPHPPERCEVMLSKPVFSERENSRSGFWARAR